MRINVSEARHQAQMLGNNASTLLAIRKQLESFQGSLNSHWQAEEMNHVNRAINNIQDELSSIAATLTQLEAAIVHTAQAIRQEEIAEEERQRQLEEAKQKEREMMLKQNGR
ncbi:hypothetical protein A8F94_09510 [Bacillus sp. FJAT-27225]|uniref:hypothetical protein n=1 Tax=Bacillus sp. FJAT-27225 TaxID=1743144 RepID=UPI00080C27EF|nr:hypothetical protein [Bacillus sp. FJAT-27225]OCA88049.1 hypothetical protein A8F94_09510 [Bacillus sp. FJAT-27225]